MEVDSAAKNWPKYKCYRSIDPGFICGQFTMAEWKVTLGRTTNHCLTASHEHFAESAFEPQPQVAWGANERLETSKFGNFQMALGFAVKMTR